MGWQRDQPAEKLVEWQSDLCVGALSYNVHQARQIRLLYVQHCSACTTHLEARSQCPCSLHLPASPLARYCFPFSSRLFRTRSLANETRTDHLLLRAHSPHVPPDEISGSDEQVPQGAQQSGEEPIDRSRGRSRIRYGADKQKKVVWRCSLQQRTDCERSDWHEERTLVRVTSLTICQSADDHGGFYHAFRCLIIQISAQ